MKDITRSLADSVSFNDLCEGKYLHWWFETKFIFTVIVYTPYTQVSIMFNNLSVELMPRGLPDFVVASRDFFRVLQEHNYHAMYRISKLIQNG